jgi:hypothetical protein
VKKTVKLTQTPTTQNNFEGAAHNLNTHTIANDKYLWANALGLSFNSFAPR